ncbi:MAG TPA: fumarylacetoacetate hydrolase family protein [Vicinamibacterales bacterium]|nr:fumarylacetoacetate hydrolase family protein [Vicinamibacterales bacterium]
MKLIRFGPAGRERPGAQLDDGRRVDVSAIGADFDEEFFAGGGLARLRAWLARDAAQAAEIPAGARLGPPVARPGKIVCIGLNYRDHAAESGMDVPKEPVIFLKATSSLAGPNDAVVIPRGGTKLDYEVELGIVIGRRASDVAQDAAASYVAGYVLHNDYSERAFQLERGGQWVKGKSCDTFAPLGPFLATADEISDPHRLRIWLSVNGEMRQDSTTANMIFDVPTLVSYVSQFMTLAAGDVISTGTPPGVALGMKPAPVYLKAGDVVRLGIDGLGESSQKVVDGPAVAG